jgi:hypothetical protein
VDRGHGRQVDQVVVVLAGFGPGPQQAGVAIPAFDTQTDPGLRPQVMAQLFAQGLQRGGQIGRQLGGFGQGLAQANSERVLCKASVEARAPPGGSGGRPWGRVRVVSGLSLPGARVVGRSSGVVDPGRSGAITWGRRASQAMPMVVTAVRDSPRPPRPHRQADRPTTADDRVSMAAWVVLRIGTAWAIKNNFLWNPDPEGGHYLEHTVAIV